MKTKELNLYDKLLNAIADHAYEAEKLLTCRNKPFRSKKQR
jgi:hypothetical protein